MISQHIVSTGAAFLVLSAHLGTSDLEIGIGGHDVDRDSLMTAVAISCAKNRLLIDFLRDVEGYASGPMLLHGAALRQVFYADEPSSAANFSLGITSKATQSFSWINKHSDVTFAVDSGGGIEFCGKYHREALLRRLIDQIKHVASELATAGPEAVVGDISLISPREKEVLRTRNMGPIAGQQQCLHAVVLQIACSFPEKTAIAARDNSFLYRDVDAKSALMAHKLIDRGITPGAIVPVCLEKSGIVPIVMMAVMRAGAAFLPLDPSNPDERLGHILTESRATLVVTSRTNAGRMNSLGCKVYMVDDDPKPFECGDDAKPLPTVVPSDLAYVIYTSGKLNACIIWEAADMT